MNSILPLDLTEIVHEELERQRRPNDFLLHASSHITAPLRHVQLDVAGAPKVSRGLVDNVVLMTGTMWHEWLHNTLRRLGVPYMAEVNMTPWLPKGWSGTADAFIWNPDLKAFVLTDFKTAKGEGMRYIVRDGAKDEHVRQTSLYWHGAKAMGIPLAKTIGVYYLPKNDTRNKSEVIEPILADFAPIPKAELFKPLAERTKRVEAYRESLLRSSLLGPEEMTIEEWLTDELAPVQEREQRVYYDRPTGLHELKLVPHWTAAYCPFPDELCDCSTQGTTKLGVFEDGEYHPRDGYEHIEPVVFPA